MPHAQSVQALELLSLLMVVCVIPLMDIQIKVEPVQMQEEEEAHVLQAHKNGTTAEPVLNVT